MRLEMEALRVSRWLWKFPYVLTPINTPRITEGLHLWLQADFSSCMTQYETECSLLNQSFPPFPEAHTESFWDVSKCLYCWEPQQIDRGNNVVALLPKLQRKQQNHVKYGGKRMLGRHTKETEIACIYSSSLLNMMELKRGLCGAISSGMGPGLVGKKCSCVLPHHLFLPFTSLPNSHHQPSSSPSPVLSYLCGNCTIESKG